MNTKGNKDRRIIQTTTVCHILDGINDGGAQLKRKLNIPNAALNCACCRHNTLTDLKGVKISSCKINSCMLF